MARCTLLGGSRKIEARLRGTRMKYSQVDCIDVSVIVPTYFHESYISQALDSILMQVCSLRYEILVGDDASQDHTPEIIEDYAVRYPGVIYPILRKKNIGANRNGLDLNRRARGKYIAVLEGDDYWLDPNKLKKQWEFLEENPEYIGCCGKCLVINQKGEPDYDQHPKFFRNKKVLTFNEFLDCWELPGQIGTLMYRNIFREMRGKDDSILYQADTRVGDKTMMLLLLSRGPIYCSNDVLSCYRYVTQGGHNHFSKHYANPYRNYEMFLYPCRLETWMRKTMGIRHYHGKRKEYRFCRFVEETVREPSVQRFYCLLNMIAHSHQPVKYVGLVVKALIEMEE